jgi:hypothetical protein
MGLGGVFPVLLFELESAWSYYIPVFRVWMCQAMKDGDEV